MRPARIRRLLAFTAILALAPRGSGQNLAAPRASDEAFRWRAEASFADRAGIAEGSRSLGEIRHHAVHADAVTERRLDERRRLQFGAMMKRLEFEGSSADVPATLTAAALKLGYAHAFSREWSLAAEIDPGVYGDFGDIDADDLNAPFGLRLLNTASRELQWAFAVFVDPRSSRPVIGGVGARWQFAPRWTLLAILPSPRLEYQLNPQLAIHLGGHLRGGSFRVAEDFGRRRGRPALDNEIVDLREITVSAGVRWTISPGLTLSTGIGWMIDRRFEYDGPGLLLNGDGAPAWSIALNGSF